MANVRKKIFEIRKVASRRSIKRRIKPIQRREIKPVAKRRKINPIQRREIKQVAKRREIKREFKPVERKPVARRSFIKPVEPVEVGFLKKIGRFRGLKKGFKKFGKSLAVIVTKPVKVLTGKQLVSRSGTIFEKGFGRKIDKFTTKAGRVVAGATVAVVGVKLASGGVGKKLTTGLNPPKKGMGFLSKLTKSDFLKTAFSGAKKSLVSAGLSAFNVSDTQGDIDSTSLLGIGDKKKAEKQRNFILVLVGIGLAAIGLLVAIFKK